MYRMLLESICKEINNDGEGVLCILIDKEGSTPRGAGASILRKLLEA